jgi:hypothetical protein
MNKDQKISQAAKNFNVWQCKDPFSFVLSTVVGGGDKLLSQASGTAHSIDKSERIIGTCILAPSYMAVRPYENQLAIVQRGDFGFVDINNPKRNLANGSGSDERGCVSTLVEAQQHKPVAKQVKGRKALADPRVRRASS